MAVVPIGYFADAGQAQKGAQLLQTMIYTVTLAVAFASESVDELGDAVAYLVPKLDSLGFLGGAVTAGDGVLGFTAQWEGNGGTGITAAALVVMDLRYRLKQELPILNLSTELDQELEEFPSLSVLGLVEATA